jgi:hypothetical protein
LSALSNYSAFVSFFSAMKVEAYVNEELLKGTLAGAGSEGEGS